MTIMDQVKDLVSDESGVSDEESTGESSEAEDNEEVVSDNVQEVDLPGLNSGWADSISKILKSNKPKRKKTLVLSRAKKLTEVKLNEKIEKPEFEIEGEIKEEVENDQKVKEETDEPPKKKKKEIPSLRVKPDILEKDRERTLSRIATRGVVQLFNAVQEQQKSISQKIRNAGPLERKRDKILKNIDKRSFLDVLMRQKSEQVDIENETSTNQKMDTEVKDENEQQPSWSILRNDFMMGAKLKDWDKEESSEDEQEKLAESDSS